MSLRLRLVLSVAYLAALVPAVPVLSAVLAARRFVQGMEPCGPVACLCTKA